MQKHHQKIALFSILAVALGSSLSWNPENTNIVRHVVSESGETMLASSSEATFDSAPAKAAPVQTQQVVKEDPKKAEPTEAEIELARQKKENEELKLRLAVQEELKKQKPSRKEKRERDGDLQKFGAIKVSEDCKSLKDDESEDEEEDDEDVRSSSKVSRRLQESKSDNPRGEYLNCLKDQFVEEARACSKKEAKDLSQKERSNCGKQVVRFFEKHIEPALAVDLKKGRDSEQLREALDMAADLISDIPDVKGITKTARNRIRNKVSQMTAQGAISRGRDLMDETIQQYGDTPQTRAYALSKFREYVACEMNLRCNQMMLNQHGIPNSSFVGQLMNEAWLGGEHADKNGFMASYFNSLMPYTKNGGPIDGTATGAPVAVTPGARGNLPQFQGTFKPVASATGATTPTWTGGAMPNRPAQQGVTPVFNGGVNTGVVPGGAPYPQSRPMSLPQQTLPGQTIAPRF